MSRQEHDLDRLNVIHVAGTKGKGSTCAFIRSFLHAYGVRTGFPQKIGLYTSPDLGNFCQRIQISNRPISKTLFTRYFFEVWERLCKHESANGAARLPRFLQLLALTAFHAFIEEKVDTAIIETHSGGEFDSTNIVSNPIVTVITALGMDHVDMLGPTIEDIAWHKAGIFKNGAPALSCLQDFQPAAVLRDRATEKGVILEFVSSNLTFPSNSTVLDVPVQRENCRLALAVANTFLKRKTGFSFLIAEDIAKGIENFWWPGRFEIIIDGQNKWFIDGAHNEMSISHVAKWFANASSNLRSALSKQFFLTCRQ